MCDGPEAAKRQKSAQALAATIVIHNMYIRCKTENRASETAGCLMTLSVTVSHGLSPLIDTGFGVADSAE